ncbi:MAG: hypothetical protein ACRD3O_19250 [Terriglobia bacterium]
MENDPPERSVCASLFARLVASFLGAATLLLLIPTALAAQQRVEIGQGVRLAVRLDETISTKYHYFGPIIQATLDQDILDSRGRVAIPSGSPVKLAMAEFKRAGHVVGRAKIRLRLFSVGLADGTDAPLDGYPTRIEGSPKPGREGTFHGHRGWFKDASVESSVILVGAGAGFAVGGPWGLPVGAAAGLLTAGIYFVARRGPDLVLPAGTVIEFTLARPASVEEPPRQEAYAGDRGAYSYPPNDPPQSFDAAVPAGGVWGQGLAIPPSKDLVALLGAVNDPKAVLVMLSKIDLRNRPNSDRVFSLYLRGVCDLELAKPKKALAELDRAYSGSKSLNFPEPAQNEIARNLVLAIKASSKNWQQNPLMNDPELQAVLVHPQGE